jgi:outer membrane protein
MCIASSSSVSAAAGRGRLAAGGRIAAALVLTLCATAALADTRTQRPSPRQAPAGIATLDAALARAYAANPDILAQRAQVRATRETIPQARAAMLPQVSATTYAGVLATSSLLRGTPVNVTDSATLPRRGVALTATQTLFDGGRTQNSVVQAERLTAAQREQLRAVEQAVLLDVATTFVAVHTGQALVEVQHRNVGFLRTTLATIRTRLGAGVATPTDIAQAEARLSRGLADMNAAQADLAVARDRFLRLVGMMPALRLAGARTPERLLPRTGEAARDLAGRDNPAVLAAVEAVRGADAAVRVAQGQMLPQVTLEGQAARDMDADSATRRIDSLQVVGRMTVPLYAGGGPEAQVRQNRELAGQARMVLDSARLQARSAAYSGRVAFDNASFAAKAAGDEVRSADVTIEGIRKQLDAGLRTVTELLNAQQDAVSARARLIQAQGDRTVASFTVLAAIGHLDLPRLGIRTAAVSAPPPQSDLDVRLDAWRGLRDAVTVAPVPAASRR